MRLQFYSKDKLNRDVVEKIGKHLDLEKYKIFYFGSRVTGKGDERSDIDIGIEGQTKIPLTTVEKIQEELEELPVLYKMDVVDFSRASNSFNNIARQKVEYIWGN